MKIDVCTTFLPCTHALNSNDSFGLMFLGSPSEYGRAVHTFLTEGANAVGVDFTKRRLVGICHSVGAPAL